MLYTDIEASHHILKNIGDKQVAYFSGAGTSISKVDVTGENFKLIHRTMLPGLEKLDQNLTPGIKALLKKVDAAQAALEKNELDGEGEGGFDEEAEQSSGQWDSAVEEETIQRHEEPSLGF